MGTLTLENVHIQDFDGLESVIVSLAKGKRSAQEEESITNSFFLNQVAKLIHVDVQGKKAFANYPIHISTIKPTILKVVQWHMKSTRKLVYN